MKVQSILLRFCVVLFILHHSQGHLLDFGKCSCSCRDEEDAVPFTGPKGETGAPGKRGSQGESGPPGKAVVLDLPASCAAIKKNGIQSDGIYTIKPSSFGSSFEVYCDMTTPGGPWTLVASVHENDFQPGCSLGDKWSSEQPASGQAYSAKNWENTNVFGNVESATSDDYKSRAYFLTKGTDLMIWHVPNNSPAQDYKQLSTLAYKTTSGFLDDHGGNIRNLYKEHYPLRAKADDFATTSFDINKLMHEVRKQSSSIVKLIPNWNSYQYDDNSKKAILDGGGDIFDGGNMISFKLNDAEFQDMIYEEKYTRPGIQLNTSTGYPFFMLAWISKGVDFNFKVISDLGADGSGSLVTYGPSSLKRGHFSASYIAQHVYNATDPSILQAYFTISNSQDWGSVTPELQRTETWGTSTGELNNEVQLAGTVRNVLFGYILLSKAESTKITEDELRGVVGKYLEIVSASLPSIPRGRKIGCSLLNESLSVPVEFIKGGNSDVVHWLPPSVKTSTNPGFVHLRAYGTGGLPSAICPGAESLSCDTSEFCVGGIQSGNPSLPCGDFPNWKERNERALGESLLIFYGGKSQR